MTGATVFHPKPRLTLGRWALGATAVLLGVAALLEGGHVFSFWISRVLHLPRVRERSMP